MNNTHEPSQYAESFSAQKSLVGVGFGCNYNYCSYSYYYYK